MTDIEYDYEYEDYSVKNDRENIYSNPEAAARALEKAALEGKEIDLAIELAGLPSETSGQYGVASTGNPLSINRLGNSSVNRILINALPKQKIKKIQKAIKFSEEDDLVERLIEVKQDFTVVGFNLQCKVDESEELDVDKIDINDEDRRLTPEQLENLKAINKVQRRLNKISQKWELYDVIKSLVKDWYVTDSMILYWRVEKKEDANSIPNLNGRLNTKENLIPGLIDVAALSPGDIDWDNSLGQDILRVRIPEVVKDKILIAKSKHTKQERLKSVEELLMSGIPDKYIEAVFNGKDFVSLDRNDGDNWLIKTKNRKHHGLANPSMFGIFLSLEIRRMLKEGDLAAALIMKHLIMHVTAGESINQGPLAGQRTNWAKKDTIDTLFKAITVSNQATRIVTNHTVKFNFVHPPLELFDGKKYEKHEECIFNWVGVSVVIFSGEGGTYGSGFLSIKRLVADVIDARRASNWIISEFFDHPTIRNSIKDLPEDCDIVSIFDENVLKEPKQLLDELKFLFQNGMGDPRTSLRELGRDPDAVRRSKLMSTQDNLATNVWNPIYETNKFFNDRQNSNLDEKGRPLSTGNPPASEETRTQAPAGNFTNT